MKKIDLGQAVTILANIGVIIGIIFLAMEVRQNNQIIQDQSVIARLHAYAALASSTVDARNAINENAALWETASAGQELSGLEELVFGNLVLNLNEQALNGYFTELQLGDELAAKLTLNDFAAFLHQHPGARRVWQAREENLNRYRRLLSPEDWDLWAFWQRDISAALERLDAERE